MDSPLIFAKISVVGALERWLWETKRSGMKPLSSVETDEVPRIADVDLTAS